MHFHFNLFCTIKAFCAVVVNYTVGYNYTITVDCQLSEHICLLNTFCLFAVAPKKVIKMQKDNPSTTKKEAPTPKLNKPVSVTSSNITTPPVSIVSATQDLQYVKPLAPQVSTKSPTVKPLTASPQQIKPMPSVSTLPPDNAKKVLPQPAILLNISQHGKPSVLAVQPNPIIQLSSGEGPKIHSNAETMSLSPQIIQSVLSTSAVHQKQQQHNATLTHGQWSQLLNASKQLLVNANTAAATTSLTSSGIHKPLSLVPTNVSNLTGPSSNSQVLQEHSYQNAKMSATSNPSATQSSTTMFPKLVVNPTNLQYK